MVALIVIIAIVVIFALYYMVIYNKLVSTKNQIEEAGSAIDAHLKQRYDLVPNLVATVKGYATHEKDTLTSVIEARNKAMGATTMEQKDEANKDFSSTLKSLFALSESYPDLKANTNFLDLQQQLQTIETELLSARKYYNAVVKVMNNLVAVFPSNIVANMAHYEKLPYLAIEEEAKSRVEVKF